MFRVLVLNADYEPLNICCINRAIKLLYWNKADYLHTLDNHYINTVSGKSFVVPTVIRLKHQIKRKYFKDFRVSRIGVYSRDNFTCQYCGQKNNDLTLDHVYPRHLGGSHTWDNLVTCCKKCNNTKAWKTLEQAGMRLLSKPRSPKWSFHTLLANHNGTDYEEWNYYLV